MILVKVPDSRTDMLEEFKEKSMLTFEGINIADKKSNKAMEKAFREAGFTKKDFLGYWFKGSVMNEVYGLTGDNAYPDDLIFLVIPDFYNPTFKLACGARWFDDIVANNSIRQNASSCNAEPDYK